MLENKDLDLAGTRQTMPGHTAEDVARQKFMVLRIGLRDALGKFGIGTNPGSGDREILEYFREAVGLPRDTPFQDSMDADWETYYKDFVADVAKVTGTNIEGKDPEEIVDNIRQRLNLR